MAYITAEEYEKWYGAADIPAFDRLAFEASRTLDQMTTGVDGVKKLKNHFPAEPEDAEAVKICAAQIVNFLAGVEAVEATAVQGQGYDQTAQGLRGKVISSVSAGNESISYAASGAAGTAFNVAAADISARNEMTREIAREGLQGVCDANGVNLLYMGPYPRG